MMVNVNEMMPMIPVFLKPLKRGEFRFVRWPSLLEGAWNSQNPLPLRWIKKFRHEQDRLWKRQQDGPPGHLKGQDPQKVMEDGNLLHRRASFWQMFGCIWCILRPLVLTSPGEGMTLTGGRVENDRGVLEGFALLGDVCNLHPRESEHTFYS